MDIAGVGAGDRVVAIGCPSRSVYGGGASCCDLQAGGRRVLDVGGSLAGHRVVAVAYGIAGEGHARAQGCGHCSGEVVGADAEGGERRDRA